MIKILNTKLNSYLKYKKMLTYLLFLIFTISSLSLRLHQQRIDATMYRNSTQVQQQISTILQNTSNTNITKRQCTKNGTTYNILDINASRKQDSQGRRPLNAIITCNIHARELLTTEVCVEFVKELVKGETWRSRFIRDGIGFRVYYVGNQMRDNVLKGNYCIRTDSNNVDINRNFPTGFLGQSDGETNPGPSPLSEPFSQCIQQQVNTNKPDIFLDIHTGEFSIYFAQTKNSTERSRVIQNSVLQAVIDRVCANCRLRLDAEEGVMYMDMKIRKGIKWANLFEIFGGFNENLNSNDNCFTIFNPKSKKSYDYYTRRGKNMLLQYFINILRQERPPANTNHQ